MSTRHIQCPDSLYFIVLERSSYFTDMFAAHLVPENLLQLGTVDLGEGLALKDTRVAHLLVTTAD